MKPKVVLGLVVIVVGVILGSVSFVESNVEYVDFDAAHKSHKKVQVKGEWMKDRKSGFDSEKAQFTFYLKDDNNRIERVVLEGAKPNNFELATSVVAKGTYKEDYFHATDVLTKCPSKYEGDAESVKKSL